MTIRYEVVSLKERYDLFEEQDQISGAAWPEFMLKDPVAITYWMQLIEAFKDYQLMILSGKEILAVINSVPFRFEEEIKALPDEGADWGVKQSIGDFENRRKPNFLMGVQVVINKEHQGKGLSAISVKEMLNLAMRKNISNLIVPVRPSNKHRYPLIPMKDYVEWKREDGLLYDNWLRTHLKLGGEIVRICSRSMYIPGTIEEWEKWTGLSFPGSGQYIVAGALNPITVDKGNNKGVYIEPNVWVLHKGKSV